MMGQSLTIVGGLAVHKHVPIAHLFLGLLAIDISSLEKWLFKSFANFWIGFFVLLSCKSSLHILDINPYQIYGLQIQVTLEQLGG